MANSARSLGLSRDELSDRLLKDKKHVLAVFETARKKDYTAFAEEIRHGVWDLRVGRTVEEQAYRSFVIQEILEAVEETEDFALSERRFASGGKYAVFGALLGAVLPGPGWLALAGAGAGAAIGIRRGVAVELQTRQHTKALLGDQEHSWARGIGKASHYEARGPHRRLLQNLESERLRVLDATYNGQ